MSRLSLTPPECDAFAADGYVLRRGMFDGDEVALMQRAMTEDPSIAANVVKLQDDQGGATEIALWNHPGDDVFGAVARMERLVDSMAALLGGEAYHYHSKLTMKTPRTGGAWNWHQDYGYWYKNGCLFPHLASVMIAIDPARRENGCLRVVRGSHELGRIEHEIVGGQTTAQPDRMHHILEKLDVVECEMDPGDALFFHCNTLHASSQNTSARPRNVLICCYNAARNNPVLAHHHPFYTPLEPLPDGDLKARAADWLQGHRDYFDPEQDRTIDIKAGTSAE